MYLERIDLASLVPSMMKKLKELKDDPKTEHAKEFVEMMESAGDDQAKIQQFSQEFTTPISSLAMFHMKLMQDKKMCLLWQPGYAGGYRRRSDAVEG